MWNIKKKQNEFREDVKKLRKILFDNTDSEILKIKQGDSELKLRRISFQKEILERVLQCTNQQNSRLKILDNSLEKEENFHQQILEEIDSLIFHKENEKQALEQRTQQFMEIQQKKIEEKDHSNIIYPHLKENTSILQLCEVLGVASNGFGYVTWKKLEDTLELLPKQIHVSAIEQEQHQVLQEKTTKLISKLQSFVRNLKKENNEILKLKNGTENSIRQFNEDCNQVHLKLQESLSTSNNQSMKHIKLQMIQTFHEKPAVLSNFNS